MKPFWYRSSYRNSVIALRSTGGRIGLVAGKHDRHYPYYESPSWDHLLIHVEGAGYALSAPHIAALHLDRSGPSRYRIAFRGPLRGSEGRTRELDIDLHFELEPGDAYTLGSLVDWRWMPGMRWQPYACTLLPAQSRFAMDGESLSLRRGHGEHEHGELLGLSSRRLAIRYDYSCMVRPDTGCVLLDVEARALTRCTLTERLVDELLRRTGRVALTLGCEAGEVPVELGAAEVLVEDRVDLGLALLDRQLVSVRDPHGRELVGLRERFQLR